MKKILLTLVFCTHTAYAFWPFDVFSKEREPLPSYALVHPQITEAFIYGIGSGKNFLEAKSKALNDISTQLSSDVRSITSVHKNTATGTTSDQQITLLTKRLITNYTILDESHVNGEVYLLIGYKR